MIQVKAVDNRSKPKSKTKRESKELLNDAGTLTQIFDYIYFIGNPLGWKCSYEWTWKNNWKFWTTFTFLTYTWSQLIYTQIKSFISGEYKKIFQVFALYGAGIYVIEIY